MLKLATVTIAVSLLASVAVAEPFAQDRSSDDAAPVAERQKAQKEQAKKIEAKRAEGRPSRQAEPKGTPAGKKASEGEGPAGKLDRREVRKVDTTGMTRKFAVEERKHRTRLAKIARLRKLAELKKQTERVAALDALLEKENARHVRWVAKSRSAMGDKEFEEIDSKLRKGRRHPIKDGVPPNRTEKPSGRAPKKSDAPVDKEPVETDRD
jgi:hypothetical protein